MTSKDARFTCQDLGCIRGERLVFAGLSAELSAGEAMVLRGRNGSGKSSLLRLAAGLLSPAAGSMLWNGTSVGDDPAAHRARVAYVGHQDAVKPVLTVWENALFWACNTGANAAAAEAALAGMALDRLADAPAQILSAGQRRRLNLSRLLSGLDGTRPPPLWLLDEPTTGLDRDSTTLLESAIARHREAGGMVMLATHTDVSLGEARTLPLADYVPDPDSAVEAFLS